MWKCEFEIEYQTGPNLLEKAIDSLVKKTFLTLNIGPEASVDINIAFPLFFFLNVYYLYTNLHNTPS